MKRKWVIIISSLIIVGLLAASCAQGPTAAPPEQFGSPSATPKSEAEKPIPGGILNISARLNPEHWDLHQAEAGSSLWPVGPVYSSLVRYDWQDNEKIIPDLAEKWTISQDNLVYSFNLRQGVKWHDAQPFTSADAKFSLDRVRKPPQGVLGPRRALLQSVSNIETPDDYTVKITTSYPDASLLTVIAMPWNSIFPKHIVEEKGDMKTTIVGTGPFKFKNYSPGVNFEVVKNPDYFLKGLPYLDGINRYYLLDSTKRFAAFRAGQVDIVEYGSFTPSQAEQLQKELPQVKVLDQRGVCVNSLYFNVERKPWSDVRVRKAVSLAFDRQLAIKIPNEGHGDIGWVLSPTSTYAIPQTELGKLPGFRQPKDADFAEAKKLLADAGFPDGFKTDMMWRSGPSYEPTATFLHNQLGKLGIDVNLRSLDTAPLYEAGGKGDYDTFDLIRCSTMTDPNGQLIYFVSKESANYSRYKNADIDRLFDEQSRTLDTSKRKDTVIKMQQKLLDDMPAIVVAWQAHIMGWHPKVKNYVPGLTVYNNIDYHNTWLGK